MANLSNINNKFIVTDGNNGRVLIGATNDIGATLFANHPSTTAPSLTFNAPAGQVFENEDLQIAFGLNNASPYNGYMQTRFVSAPYYRNLSINPLGGNLGVGTNSPSGKITSEAAGNHLHLRANTAPAGKYWNFDVTANNQLYIITDGNNGINITNTGYVGIGTVTNTARLNVGGKLKITDDLIMAQTNGRIDYDNGVSSGALRFFSTSGNTERMRITSGGDIEVQGGDIFLNSGTSYNDKGVVYLSNERTAIISDIVNATANGDTSLDFQTRSGGSRSSAMFIDEFKRVGIGTTSPQTQLHINEDASNSYAVLRLEGSNRGGAIEMFNQTSYPVSRILTDQSGNTYFSTSGAFASTTLSTKMTILTGGDVGIGTTTPSGKLEVNGNNYNTNSLTTFTLRDLGNNYSDGDNSIDIVMRSRYWSGDANTSQNSKIRHLKDNGNGSTGTMLQFGTTTEGSGDASTKMTIKANGNVGIGTVSPNRKLTISDGTTNNYLVSAKWYKGASSFSNPFIVIVSNFTNTSSYPQIIIKINLIGHGISANRAQFTEAICTYDLTNGDLQQTTISHKTVGSNAVSAGVFSVSGTSIGFTPLRQTNYDQFKIEADIQSYSATFDY